MSTKQASPSYAFRGSGPNAQTTRLLHHRSKPSRYWTIIDNKSYLSAARMVLRTISSFARDEREVVSFGWSSRHLPFTPVASRKANELTACFTNRNSCQIVSDFDLTRPFQMMSVRIRLKSRAITVLEYWTIEVT